MPPRKRKHKTTLQLLKSIRLPGAPPTKTMRNKAKHAKRTACRKPIKDDE